MSRSCGKCDFDEPYNCQCMLYFALLLFLMELESRRGSCGDE